MSAVQSRADAITMTLEAGKTLKLPAPTRLEDCLVFESRDDVRKWADFGLIVPQRGDDWLDDAHNLMRCDAVIGMFEMGGGLPWPYGIEVGWPVTS
jgi:hypothetical protein